MDHIDFHRNGFEGILKDFPEISHDEYIRKAKRFISDNEETDDLEPYEIEGVRKDMELLAEEVWKEHKAKRGTK